LPRLRASALVLLALGAAGCGGAKTVTVTQTRTVTVTAPPPGVPAAVAKTHAQLLAAASGDYEKLRPLIPAKGFAYSYGGDFAGGPIAYWKNVEQTSGQRPIEILASILRMPYTLNRGLYVWPFAYDKRKSELTAYERGLLGPLVRSYVGEDYYGWRAGFKPDGTWIFFISGD
jgi:hypothetical protein